MAADGGVGMGRGAGGADDRGGLKRRGGLFSIVGVARGALDEVDGAAAWGPGGGRRREAGHLGVAWGLFIVFLSLSLGAARTVEPSPEL